MQKVAPDNPERRRGRDSKIDKQSENTSTIAYILNDFGHKESSAVHKAIKRAECPTRGHVPYCLGTQ